jgi:hypothetical protein
MARSISPDMATASRALSRNGSAIKIKPTSILVMWLHAISTGPRTLWSFSRPVILGRAMIRMYGSVIA